jgi:TRAP transporter 4TM/12TM fusion protein
VIIASVFLIYAYFGAYFQGFLAHRGYSLRRIASHMYLTTEGIMGIPLWVSSTFIYLFVLFGAFREKTGLGQLFIDLSNAVAGWASGGPAKVAVVTSALEGMISGSSVANTVESGSFTIPMMKRLGYRPEFAAAVEASASTGGQIMPPIMGAAAFIMAEFLNMPYIEIAKAAAIPACLYFFGVFIEVTSRRNVPNSAA